ncbi:kinase [Daedalea quercina L-15889]|uniref:mitogen-activated protein kinase kinase n=1 Tax=Daedalea quercina L-15889 TaxID=1314783 RepID=A0A165RNZ5_9APHY|nr:kinase [Daedalea quercina L-15889]
MSLHASPARPAGPRTLQRSASPSPGLTLPDITPLNIRRNGASPKPKLKLPAIDFNKVEGGAFNGEYTGGAIAITPNLNGKTMSPGDLTVKPGEQTVSPRPRASSNAFTIDHIREKVRGFDEWSDDYLEELDRLGEGAGGAVYKVRDKRTGQIMARKTITTLEAPMKQLMREIQIISSTSHHNIIHFYGAYISPSSSEVKVLMDLCEGGSLESVGKRLKETDKRVNEKVAGRLAEGILQGLAYLHKQKTIHRDIKPPNILLTREGVVKLCDFGVSGELVNSMAGTFTGTSLYMAPERLSGLEYTIRSDVWSTGISLLELVQNRFPFPSDLAAIELMMYITQHEPPELEDDGPFTYSAEMKDFIKQALTRDPILRPIPARMLEHPWIKDVMQQEVNMAVWIRKVWSPPRSRQSGET